MSDADSVEKPDTVEPTVKNIQVEVEWTTFPFNEGEAVRAITAHLEDAFPEYEAQFQHVTASLCHLNSTAGNPIGRPSAVSVFHIFLTHKKVKSNPFAGHPGVESFLPSGPMVPGSLAPELHQVSSLPAPEPSPFNLLKEEMLDRGHLRPEELSRNV